MTTAAKLERFSLQVTRCIREDNCVVLFWKAVSYAPPFGYDRTAIFSNDRTLMPNAIRKIHTGTREGILHGAFSVADKGEKTFPCISCPAKHLDTICFYDLQLERELDSRTPFWPGHDLYCQDVLAEVKPGSAYFLIKAF